MNDFRYHCKKLKKINCGDYTLCSCPKYGTNDYINCADCERSKPHWREGGYCSKCGYDITYNLDRGDDAPNVCPNCGVKMVKYVEWGTLTHHSEV